MSLLLIKQMFNSKLLITERFSLFAVFTHFIPLVSFFTPKKTGGFLMFSGGKEGDQWHEMG